MRLLFEGAIIRGAATIRINTVLASSMIEIMSYRLKWGVEGVCSKGAY